MQSIPKQRGHMPIFKRCDGVLIKRSNPVRALMPYLMRGRNESIAFTGTVFDLSKALPWLDEFNRGRPPGEHATIFHLVLWASARIMHECPGLNRFVSGQRLYQREQVTIAFAAKKEFNDKAPITTIKLEFAKDESFADCVKKIRSAVGEGRTAPERPVDKEVRLVMLLPSFVLKAVTSLLRWLDSHNMMPASMIESDPMYASVFLANLGSLGFDAVYHHLFEWGTVGLFGVVGNLKKHIFITDDSHTEVRDAVLVRWSFDERVNDGFYCARSLDLGRAYVENPAEHAK